MATKKFCDRCGKEIKGYKLFRPKTDRVFQYWLSATLTREGDSFRPYDLCYECHQMLLKFLNRKTYEDLKFITEVCEYD